MSLIPEDNKRYRKQKDKLHLDKIRINYIIDRKELFDVLLGYPNKIRYFPSDCNLQGQKFSEIINAHFLFWKDDLISKKNLLYLVSYLSK